MNYISVQIAGKTLGLYFGMEATERIIKKYSSKEIPEKPTPAQTINLSRDIIWAGYLNFCEVKDIIPEITSEEIYLYIEQNANEESVLDQIKIAFDTWNDLNKSEKNGEPDDKEKKSLKELTGEASGPSVSVTTTATPN